MGEANWLTNQPGENIGEIHVHHGKEIKGIQIRVQNGVGIIDLRLAYRNDDGTDSGVDQFTGWLTGNTNFHTEHEKYIPNDKQVIGIEGQVQNRIGLIDLRLILRNRDGTATSNLFSEWVTGDRSSGLVYESIVEDGAIAVGIEGIIQIMNGIEDLRLLY
ncbi:hypothetical protein CN581_31140 [Bacillus toyonensis]|uniref:hypothetical protein n=1 Tax=Bacillus toyonensis TaxID=155322 RepID=UPI000BF605DC|nr:hypothetical protein [Bacillus toyonensis]PEP71703.1 hypothetical protein CN581_31140 [Bacillus toyonensis]